MYLGFFISKQVLKVDPKKFKEIMEWPSPKNVIEVRSFHGLASFYRKFIRNFSHINAPMLETIRKNNQPFMWTKEAERSFQTLKRKVSEQLVLVFPDFRKPFQVRCDASGRDIGAVLSQDDRPVAYFSETMNDAKLTLVNDQKYSSYDHKILVAYLSEKMNDAN